MIRKFGVNFRNHSVCGGPRFVEQSFDDTLKAITLLEISFGEVLFYSLLPQMNLKFKILDKIFHPLEYRNFSFDVEIFEVYKIVILGIVLISR